MSNRITAVKKLADFIEAHPDCIFEIDNDAWYMLDKDGNEIANSENHHWDTEWYSHSSNYGAGIAEALIELLNRRDFNISAAAV